MSQRPEAKPVGKWTNMFILKLRWDQTCLAIQQSPKRWSIVSQEVPHRMQGLLGLMFIWKRKFDVVIRPWNKVQRKCFAWGVMLRCQISHQPFQDSDWEEQRFKWLYTEAKIFRCLEVGHQIQWLPELLSIEQEGKSWWLRLEPRTYCNLSMLHLPPWTNSNIERWSWSSFILIKVGLRAMGISKHQGSHKKEVLAELTQLIWQKGLIRVAVLNKHMKNQEQLPGA